jgi:hypothetical protein
MWRRVLVACAVLAAIVFSTSAQAGIPIPCTGAHFLKAEGVTGARDARGQPIELYYNVFGCSDGRWDGYRGADGKYHELTSNIRSSIPEAPGFWASAWHNKAAFWAEWLWMVIGAFVVVGTLLSKLSGVDASSMSGIQRNQARLDR